MITDKEAIPIEGKTIEDQPEDIITTACLWAEDRGDGYVGMLAVLWVIHNLAKEKNKSFKEIVIHPWRFSSFNNNDPEKPHLLKAYKEDPINWQKAWNVLKEFKEGFTNVIDPIDGANHYCVNDLWNTDDGSHKYHRWFSKQQIDLGKTIFKKIIGRQTYAWCA